MIQEDEFISYIESLAIQNKSINHDPKGRKSFFYIEDAFDLDEFDNALRNCAQSPALMLAADDGSFTDNGSENNVQEIEAQLLVIGLKNADSAIRAIRGECLKIGLDFLARIKSDSRQGKILNDPMRRVTFRIDRVPYKKIGPLNDQWYGYEFSMRISCPFAPAVSSGSWRDINHK